MPSASLHFAAFASLLRFNRSIPLAWPGPWSIIPRIAAPIRGSVTGSLGGRMESLELPLYEPNRVMVLSCRRLGVSGASVLSLNRNFPFQPTLTRSDEMIRVYLRPECWSTHHLPSHQVRFWPSSTGNSMLLVILALSYVPLL